MTLRNKTPEQLAEEYANNQGDLEDTYCWRADRDGFLAGYQAAKDQLADVDKVMNSSNNSNGWISVKERLPEVGAPCLVTCHEERYAIAEYDGIKWTTLNSIAYYHPIVTHWQGLPEAPKEEK